MNMSDEELVKKYKAKRVPECGLGEVLTLFNKLIEVANLENEMSRFSWSYELDCIIDQIRNRTYDTGLTLDKLAAINRERKV